MSLESDDPNDRTQMLASQSDSVPDLILSVSRCTNLSRKDFLFEPPQDRSADLSALKSACHVRHIQLSSVSVSLNFLLPNPVPPFPTTELPQSDHLAIADVLFPKDDLLLDSVALDHGLEVKKYTHDDEGDCMLIARTPRSSFSDLFGTQLSPSSSDLFRDLQSSQSSETSSGTAESAHATQGSCLADFPSSRSLVDAAFRHSIIAKPKRLSTDIVVNDSGMVMRLADLAPSIFNPRYAQTMTEHIPYIDVIASSMATGLSLTEAPDLKARYDRLLEYDHHITTRPDCTDNKAYVKEAIKAGIWNAFAYCLRDPESARLLKPLDCQAPNPYDSDESEYFEALSARTFVGGVCDDTKDLLTDYEDLLYEDDPDSDEDESDVESCLFEAGVNRSLCSRLSNQDCLNLQRPYSGYSLQPEETPDLMEPSYGQNSTNKHSQDTAGSNLINCSRESAATEQYTYHAHTDMLKPSKTAHESELEMLEPVGHTTSHCSATKANDNPATLINTPHKPGSPSACEPPNSSQSNMLEPAISMPNDHPRPTEDAQRSPETSTPYALSKNHCDEYKSSESLPSAVDNEFLFRPPHHRGSTHIQRDNLASDDYRTRGLAYTTHYTPLGFPSFEKCRTSVVGGDGSDHGEDMLDDYDYGDDDDDDGERNEVEPFSTGLWYGDDVLQDENNDGDEGARHRSESDCGIKGQIREDSGLTVNEDWDGDGDGNGEMVDDGVSEMIVDTDVEMDTDIDMLL